MYCIDRPWVLESHDAWASHCFTKACLEPVPNLGLPIVSLTVSTMTPKNYLRYPSRTILKKDNYYDQFEQGYDWSMNLALTTGCTFNVLRTNTAGQIILIIPYCLRTLQRIALLAIRLSTYDCFTEFPFLVMGLSLSEVCAQLLSSFRWISNF